MNRLILVWCLEVVNGVKHDEVETKNYCLCRTILGQFDGVHTPKRIPGVFLNFWFCLVRSSSIETSVVTVLKQKILAKMVHALTILCLD